MTGINTAQEEMAGLIAEAVAALGRVSDEWRTSHLPPDLGGAAYPFALDLDDQIAAM
jgi:hypothetical protein